MRRLLLVLASVVAGGTSSLLAQDGVDDATRIALAWHRMSGVSLDVERVAQRSDAVRRASNFDRPEVLASEVRRLEGMLAAGDSGEAFSMRIQDQISDYDHDRQEFSITLFQPGYFIPVTAFGQQYQVVFANAEGARAIPMPRDSARVFDQQLAALSRSVITEVRFRVIGQGDPAGGVTGERVIRAELVEARVLDREDRVLAIPRVAPVAEERAFAAGAMDVAGFRIGVRVKDLEATLTRLFGSVDRGGPGQDPMAGVVGIMQVNPMGCMNIPGRPDAKPGAVCVTAWYDGDDIVRAIRIERLFPSLNGELVRRALVARYGPVSTAAGSSGIYLGWGPEVTVTSNPDRPVRQRALTASFSAHESFLGRSGNRIPDTKLVLHLIDADWASR